MKRERKPDRLLDLVDETAQAGQPPDRGNGRAAPGHADIRKGSCRLEDRVEIEHGLAHAHEDRVVDRLSSSEMESLIEDLRCRQVPAESHLAGRAKRARERATGLRRETEGTPAVSVTHQNCLDRMTVAGTEQRLHGAVTSSGLSLEVERRERHLVLEVAAELARKVGHLRVARDATGGPRPHLAHPVGRLSAFLQAPLQQHAIHGSPG